MKDFSRMFTSLLDKCFIDCVSDFTSSALSSKEVCVSMLYDSVYQSLNSFNHLILQSLVISLINHS